MQSAAFFTSAVVYKRIVCIFYTLKSIFFCITSLTEVKLNICDLLRLNASLQDNLGKKVKRKGFSSVVFYVVV